MKVKIMSVSTYKLKTSVEQWKQTLNQTGLDLLKMFW